MTSWKVLDSQSKDNHLEENESLFVFKVPGLFEGDIMGAKLTDRGLLDPETTKWPGGIVYYTIDSNSYCKIDHFTALFVYFLQLSLIFNGLSATTAADYVCRHENDRR